MRNNHKGCPKTNTSPLKKILASQGSSGICEIAKITQKQMPHHQRGFMQVIIKDMRDCQSCPKKCLTVKEDASHANFKVGRHEKGNTEKSPKTWCYIKCVFFSPKLWKRRCYLKTSASVDCHSIERVVKLTPGAVLYVIARYYNST